MMNAPKPPATAAVRPLRWTDFDDLRESYYLLYDERASGVPIGITLFADRPSVADETSWFTSVYRKMLDGQAVTSVAEVGGRAVGICTIARAGPGPRSEQDHVGELGITVHRDHRGKGLGTALLTDALERSRPLFEVVRLAVFSNNTRARQLYERFGFRGIGRVPRAVRRGATYFDLDLMVLLWSPSGSGSENR